MNNDDKHHPDYLPPGYDETKDNIVLVPNDPTWPDQAKLEIDFLKKHLPSSDIVDIQHVGSTAIPNILAKPIIDLQIAVRSLEKIKPVAIELLEKNNYVFWYGNPDKERLLFIKNMPPFGKERTHHVHIVEPTSRHWHEKIAFRDYLIQHPETAKKYEALKIKLAKGYEFDREKYTQLKTDFINNILKMSK